MSAVLSSELHCLLLTTIIDSLGSVENAGCGVWSAECGVWKKRSAECGKYGVRKTRSVENNIKKNKVK